MTTTYVKKVRADLKNPKLSALFDPILAMAKSLAQYQIETSLKENLPLLNHLLSSDATFFKHPESEHLIIVFATGWNNFGVSLPVLHAMLKNFQASILYIKNCDKGMYCDGSHGLGASIDEILINLKGYINKNPYAHISVLGFSSAGYAALLIAMELHAQTFVGFGIRTDWSVDCKIKSSPSRSRPAPRHRKTNTLINLAHSVNARFIDSAVLFFGEQDLSDRLHAQNMCAHKNFQIVKVPKSTHHVVNKLVADGKFEEILRNYVYKSPEKIALKAIETADTKRGDNYVQQLAGSTEVKKSLDFKPRLLVVDDRVPIPSLGAGYPRAAKILQEIVDDGWSTTLFTNIVHWVYCDNPYHSIPKTVKLAPFGSLSLESFLGSHLGHFDAILVSRPHNMRLLKEAIAKVPGWELVPILYDAEAIFAERDAALAQLKGLKKFNYEHALAVELELAFGAETVFSVSKSEARTFRAGGCDDVRVLGHSVHLRPLGEGPENRRDMLFVGALDDDHSPNADSLVWFVQTIMPLIDKEIGENWRLDVAGRAAAQSVRALASERVRILGEVDDLDPLYASARLLIAPTRYAAGIPMKIHEAASVGLPVVATDILTQQLGWIHGHELMSANSADDFAAGCVQVYRDEVLWSRLRVNGMAAIQRDCDPGVFSSTIRDALRESLPLNLLVADLGGLSPLHAPSPAIFASAVQDRTSDLLLLGRDIFATSQTAPAVVPSSVVLSPEAAARPDRSALATKFRDIGLGYFKDGNIPEAYANFRFALNCAPDDAQTHALIASTALRLGALHLALDHAAKALDQQPDQLDALLAMAGARLRLKHAKARASVEALMPFEQLGDFRSLLRMAVETAEGNYEATLVDIADYTETHPQDIFAKELLGETFRALCESPDQDRFQQFLDGVGVLADEGIALPLDKPDAGQAACVDIIIPVHNSLGYMQNCLGSIRRCSSNAIHKIILVDDFSSVETAAWLADYRDRHDDVLLVRNAENLGFTRAVMAGVEQSHAPYMLFLNSDTEVTSDWLDGMLEAMCARPQTALVGPLSNNAFYQSIRPASQGESEEPWDRSLEDFAALVRTFTRRAFPRVPFLSGFCLLVHRGAFDRAGGLDCVAFPYGYWEVQDLGLKLTDLGYHSVIADNVYVHHEVSGSINKARRDSLTLAGKAQMFERHSALRVLIAEAVSAMEPEVARFVACWGAKEDLLKFGVKQPQLDRAALVFGPVVEQRCLKYPPGSMAGQELCLFVTHCPLGAPHDYTLAYLSELKRAGLLVIVCLVVEDLAIPVADSLMELADGVLLRKNGGYDFGAWADLLRQFPQAWGAGRLYFANDSILGPFKSLGPIIDSIRDRNAGFFALSECTTTNLHMQSFFFGWNHANLASGVLRRFWQDVGNFQTKADVILNYEFGISPLCTDLNDTTQQIMFGFQKIFGCSPAELSGVNPTHHGWKLLLAVGFPFVKADLLRDGVANVGSNDWESVCAAQGADTGSLHRCIEVSRINRLNIGRVDGSLIEG